MRRLFRIVLWVFGIFIVAAGGIMIYVIIVAAVAPPETGNTTTVPVRSQLADKSYVSGNNWLRKSDSGLWEMYVEGSAYERGLVNGVLAKELIHYQEKVFSDQISKLVPSSFYRNFLKYFIGWFNRNLDDHVPEEYKLEILGVSRSASEEFNYIGTPYQRLLNYHAAHDIGHALQNLALVGCTSFATWDDRSANGQLLAGRNFDFYVGDRFAENKIVQFVRPDKGIPFMMITWGGMTGVVSGMNLEGLTITLNAAKSEIPSGSATPVSLLAREILQYSKNFDDAVRIAQSRKTFVSESFLISSASEGKAISIEITPDTLAVYESKENFITCTNHYQGALLGSTKSNRAQMEQSASVYRNQHLLELLDTLKKNTPEITASILRNQSGKNNRFIGYGNEKSINQLIAHHAIIFEPGKRLAWVSTEPWQLGAFRCYDLNKIFQMKGITPGTEISDSTQTISPDPFLATADFKNFIEFRRMKQQLLDGKEIDPEMLVRSNPEFYQAWVLAGDYCYNHGDFTKALKYYETALQKEIATTPEAAYIRNRIKECRDKVTG